MKKIFLAICLVPAAVAAAGIQSDPQIYSLRGGHPGQIVMLSGWSKGKRFAEYEDSRNLTPRFFSMNQAVWTWCEGKSTPNRIERIDSRVVMGQVTTIVLAEKTTCDDKAQLISNHDFPRQRWAAADATEQEVERIQTKLRSAHRLRVTRVVSEVRGVLYLVSDPSIETIHDTGGSRLLDAALNQISMIDSAPLSPLIDLDDDGVPEFYMPSSDGMEAWLVRMFPELNRELSYSDKASAEAPRK